MKKLKKTMISMSIAVGFGIVWAGIVLSIVIGLNQFMYSLISYTYQVDQGLPFRILFGCLQKLQNIAQTHVVVLFSILAIATSYSMYSIIRDEFLGNYKLSK